YALGHPAIPIEGRLVAALLHGGAGALLSHQTAAWWWGLLDHEPIVIDVSALGRSGSVEGVRVHHPSTLPGARWRRLPLTTVPRALAQAEYRRLLDIDRVLAVCGRGCHGAAQLRAALERHEPRIAMTRSELERRFLALCEAAGLLLPELNVVVEGWTVDALWR